MQIATRELQTANGDGCRLRDVEPHERSVRGCSGCGVTRKIICLCAACDTAAIDYFGVAASMSDQVLFTAILITVKLLIATTTTAAADFVITTMFLADFALLHQAPDLCLWTNAIIAHASPFPQAKPPGALTQIRD
jgi:hypothetical protein